MTPASRSTAPRATFTAFQDHREIATGSLAEVARAVKEHCDAMKTGDAAEAGGDSGALLVFDDRNARVVDLDLRGTVDDVVARLPQLEAFLFPDPAKASATKPGKTPAKKRGPGRPKLGVVGKEVTLLPRHWQWLDRQPGGASVTLRKLVESARRATGPEERRRSARDAAYRFMSAMAGDLPGFEEASRALFAEDRDKLLAESAGWPEDVRRYTLRLLESGDHA